MWKMLWKVKVSKGLHQRQGKKEYALVMKPANACM